MSVHGLVRWISRRALRWFYREITVVGADRLPPTGPVLLVGNHPNDLPDILLGLTATSRPVRYVANSTAAESPIVARIYGGMGVIPVVRVRDARKQRERGVDPAEANRLAFDRVRAAFRGADVVGLFPEGQVHAGPEIGRIRMGVAQLAVESSVSGAISGVQMVAIGVQYEVSHEPDSDVLVLVGEPIDLDHWVAAAGARPALEFAGEIRRALETVSRTASSAADAELRDRVMAAIGGAIVQPGESAMAAAERVRGQWAALAGDPTVRDGVAVIGAATERAGGYAASAGDCARLDLAASGAGGRRWGAVLRTLTIAPVAAIGMMLHAPVFALVWRNARRIAGPATDRAAKSMVPGLYLIFVWYLLLCAGWYGALYAFGALPIDLPIGLPGAGFSPERSIAGLLLVAAPVLLPYLGDAAARGRRVWAAVRFEGRVRGWSDTDRLAIRLSMAALRKAWLTQSGSAVSAFAGVLT